MLLGEASPTGNPVAFCYQVEVAKERGGYNPNKERRAIMKQTRSMLNRLGEWIRFVITLVYRQALAEAS